MLECNSAFKLPIKDTHKNNGKLQEQKQKKISRHLFVAIFYRPSNVHQLGKSSFKTQSILSKALNSNITILIIFWLNQHFCGIKQKVQTKKIMPTHQCYRASIERREHLFSLVHALISVRYAAQIYDIVHHWK